MAQLELHPVTKIAKDRWAAPMRWRARVLGALCAICAMLLALAAAPAAAQLTIEITGAGEKRLPVAIVPLAGEGALPASISSIVRADLERSGLFRGIELVADRDTKKPFDPALRVHARLKQAALAQGLMCYPTGGTVNGVRGDHVLLAPPFIIEETQLDELVEKLVRALDLTLAGVFAAA